MRGGQRVSKLDARVGACGEMDELNAVLGVAASCELPVEVNDGIRRIQGELFELGAWIAGLGATKSHPLTLTADSIQALEQEIDRMEEQLPSLQHFILPGGSPSAAAFHLARTVARRVERTVLQLLATETEPSLVGPYLNRLSDWLFVAARRCNQHSQAEEIKWIPPAR